MTIEEAREALYASLRELLGERNVTVSIGDGAVLHVKLLSSYRAEKVPPFFARYRVEKVSVFPDDELPEGFHPSTTAPEYIKVRVFWGTLGGGKDYGVALRIGDTWFDYSSENEFALGHRCARPVAWRPKE